MGGGNERRISTKEKYYDVQRLAGLFLGRKKKEKKAHTYSVMKNYPSAGS